jgi:hypothetical protein
MKTTKYLYVVIFLIFLLLVVDYNLSFYGKGNNFMNTKLNYDLNTDFDPLEGFKIEEEGFIQVIGYNTEIQKDVKVKQILKYSSSSNGIICEFNDSKNNIGYVIITADKSNLLSYKLIKKSETKGDLKWYDVFDSKYLKVLNFSNFILKLAIVITLILFIFKLIRKK